MWIKWSQSKFSWLRCRAGRIIKHGNFYYILLDFLSHWRTIKVNNIVAWFSYLELCCGLGQPWACNVMKTVDHNHCLCEININSWFLNSYTAICFCLDFKKVLCYSIIKVCYRQGHGIVTRINELAYKIKYVNRIVTPKCYLKCVKLS